MICPICREAHTDSSGNEQVCDDEICQGIDKFLKRQMQLPETENKSRKERKAERIKISQ